MYVDVLPNTCCLGGATTTFLCLTDTVGQLIQTPELHKFLAKGFRLIDTFCGGSQATELSLHQFITMWTSRHAEVALLVVFELCHTSARLLATRDSLPISRVSPEDWQGLNNSVGGKRFATLPVGLPCYDNFNGEPRSPDEAACANVVASKNNMTFLTTQIGGYAQVRHIEIVWSLLTDRIS